MQGLHLTPAIVWSLLGTLFSGVAGPAAAILIAHRFSPELQGYYYTFNSLLALSVFLELGFNTCIVQFISHESAHLVITEERTLKGPGRHLGRLVSLARLSFKWYLVAAILLFLGVGIGGEIFFRLNDHGDGISWRWAWWLLCFTSAANLTSLPLLAILDGCDQVNWTARARIFQNIGRSSVLILLLFLGFGLYAPAIASLAALLVLAFQYFKQWKKLTSQIIASVEVEEVSWKKEIWPMQWRIAISWASGYFIFSIFSPLLFASAGAKAAGQFGMTWAFVMAISTISQSFVVTRAPRFGSLISRGDWLELRKLWRVSVVQSIGLCLLAFSVFISGIFLLEYFKSPFRQRLIGMVPLLALCMATLINQLVFTIATLARAEKREPFLWSSVTVAVFVSVGCYVSAQKYQVSGVAFSYLGGCVLGLIWAIFIYKKTQMNIMINSVTKLNEN